MSQDSAWERQDNILPHSNFLSSGSGEPHQLSKEAGGALPSLWGLFTVKQMLIVEVIHVNAYLWW